MPNAARAAGRAALALTFLLISATAAAAAVAEIKRKVSARAALPAARAAFGMDFNPFCLALEALYDRCRAARGALPMSNLGLNCGFRPDCAKRPTPRSNPVQLESIERG